MKKKVMAVVLAMVGVGYAQTTSLGSTLTLEEAKFNQENPTETNKFGRTWKAQCAYEKSMLEKHILEKRMKEEFMKENPNGTNMFGRTFDQQRRFDKMSLDLAKRHKAELDKAKCGKAERGRKAIEDQDAKYADLKIEGLAGFRFGEQRKIPEYSPSVLYKYSDCSVRLEKPIRHFQSADLGYTFNLKNLNKITLIADARGVSDEDFNREMEGVKSIIEKKYGIEVERGRDGYFFETSKYMISISKVCNPRPFRFLKLCVADKTVCDADNNWENLPPEKDADRF